MNRDKDRICLGTYDSVGPMDDVPRTDYVTIMVKEVEAVVMALAADRVVHYLVIRKSNRASLYRSETGRVLLKALRTMNLRLGEFGYEEQCSLNPFFNVFRSSYMMDELRLYKVCFSRSKLTVSECADALNDFVDRVRLMYADADLQPLLKRLRRGAKQRAKSMRECLDYMFKVRSRLLVTRIDLEYMEGTFTGVDLAHGLAQVKAHWSQMYRALHNGLVQHLRGFVARIEYGILTGYHIHLLLFFDGSDRKGDITLNAIIGEHWSNNITQRRGRYWNCNRYKEEYPTPALGMVEHSDTEKRETLKGVIVDYFAKPDSVSNLHFPYERTAFRSVVRSDLTRRGGRPRLRQS